MRPRPWPDGIGAGSAAVLAGRERSDRTRLYNNRLLAGLLAALAAPACASSSKPAETAKPEDVTMVRHVDRATDPLPPPTLAGERCPPGQSSCKCRDRGDEAEATPPPDGQKRLEIRMSVHGGEGVLQATGVGRLVASGVADQCFYVDVPAGSKSAWSFVARASNPDAGLAPRLTIHEFGPKGPYWYEILSFDCVGLGGKCDAAGVAAWTGRLKDRKRGRMDPCGSVVITGLDWETSGGLAHRDTGLYRDFTVRFDAEVKKFATQFPPRATECVPK